MNSNDIRQIKVGDHRVGIIGLKETLEDVSATCGNLDDSELREILLERLGKMNYIAPKAKERYGEAFFREFCQYTGRSYQKVPADSDIIEIKVLGQGCSRCDQLERDMMQIAAELNLRADIEHVKDIREIAAYGVMGTPALVIDGNVKSVGKTPPKQRIVTWLNEARDLKIGQK